MTVLCTHARLPRAVLRFNALAPLLRCAKPLRPPHSLRLFPTIYIPTRATHTFYLYGSYLRSYTLTHCAHLHTPRTRFTAPRLSRTRTRLKHSRYALRSPTPHCTPRTPLRCIHRSATTHTHTHTAPPAAFLTLLPHTGSCASACVRVKPQRTPADALHARAAAWFAYARFTTIFASFVMRLS